MLRSKSGVYGANITHWQNSHWELLDQGRFTWAIVRSDCDPDIARACHQRDIQVIVQFPDRFNAGDIPHPEEYAEDCILKLHEFAEHSSIAILDNEPNLSAERCSRWWAEEYTRWYRALVACFRYHDRECHWKLVMPAMTGTARYNPLDWIRINRENFDESDSISAHCYWQTPTQMTFRNYGGYHRLLHQYYPVKRIFITEYGNSNPEASPTDRASQYPAYLVTLPDYVTAAFVFILGGTPEWSLFHLTPEIARALGDLH